MSDSNQDLENPPDPIQNHHDPRYKRISLFLQTAFNKRRFASDPPEHLESNLTRWTTLMHSFPTTILVIQILWTAIVVGASYSTRVETNLSTLSNEFWETSLKVSSSIAFGVGWALFVLLGFFMKEASHRYTTSLFNLHNIETYLIMLVRQISQMCPQAYWHVGDVQRIAAHLTAYPIALKMTLREEKDPKQLSSILHPEDLKDLMSAQSMHGHCLRVVKTYFSLTEDYDKKGFETDPNVKEPGDIASKLLVVSIFNKIDQSAYALERVATYKPAFGYINHLRIFLYIWLFFIPLILVNTSGW